MGWAELLGLGWAGTGMVGNGDDDTVKKISFHIILRHITIFYRQHIFFYYIEKQVFFFFFLLSH